MKIFYKKDFQRVLGQKIKLEKEFEEHKKSSNENISALNTKCLEQLKEINNLNSQLIDKDELLKEKQELEIKLKSASTSKGGFTKQINKLKEEIKTLTSQIKEKDELLSKRYILKTIKPGRTPNTIKTHIRGNECESRAIKYVKERL